MLERVYIDKQIDELTRDLLNERAQVEHLQATIADLQGQVEAAQANLAQSDKHWDALWKAACEQKDALQQRVAQLEGELTKAESALLRAGFKKSCDIAACNCGDQWGHGGHASQRLREIADALPYQNGGTLLGRVESLVADHARVLGLLAQVTEIADMMLKGTECEHDVGLCSCEHRRIVKQAQRSYAEGKGGGA